METFLFQHVFESDNPEDGILRVKSKTILSLTWVQGPGHTRVLQLVLVFGPKSHLVLNSPIDTHPGLDWPEEGVKVNHMIHILIHVDRNIQI